LASAPPGRVLFNLERLPRTMAFDDARLPHVVVGGAALRLNSEPVPPDAMPLAIGDHATRVAAAIDWLGGQCGDYAPRRRRFVVWYFDFIAEHLSAHRDELAERLRRFDGLYAPEDWTWSALRPLPRAWLATPNGALPADIAFWDGLRLFAVEHDTTRQRALRNAGIEVLDIAKDPVRLPAGFHEFWRGEMLPASPFRRPIPRGVVGATA
jgi:hypothetical protein